MRGERRGSDGRGCARSPPHWTAKSAAHTQPDPSAGVSDSSAYPSGWRARRAWAAYHRKSYLFFLRRARPDLAPRPSHTYPFSSIPFHPQASASARAARQPARPSGSTSWTGAAARRSGRQRPPPPRPHRPPSHPPSSPAAASARKSASPPARTPSGPSLPTSRLYRPSSPTSKPASVCADRRAPKPASASARRHSAGFGG